jgi:hypothetical protein
MPMLVELRAANCASTSDPPAFCWAAEVGFGSSGSDRSMSGLARQAELRNFTVQGRKSATGRAEELRAQRLRDVGRRAVNRLRWSA